MTQTTTAAAFDPASSAADEPSSSGRNPLPAPEGDRSGISEETESEPAPLVTPRGSVAAPSFVAPPPTDDQDLQLFD